MEYNRGDIVSYRDKKAKVIGVSEKAVRLDTSLDYTISLILSYTILAQKKLINKIGIQSEKMEDKSMDNRNYDVTNKIFEVLDNVKGFDVAMSNPREGKIIARHNGVSFYVTIEPVFNDNAEGREADNKPFEEVVKTHEWIWK